MPVIGIAKPQFFKSLMRIVGLYFVVTFLLYYSMQSVDSHISLLLCGFFTVLSYNIALYLQNPYGKIKKRICNYVNQFCPEHF